MNNQNFTNQLNFKKTCLKLNIQNKNGKFINLTYYRLESLNQS